MIELRDNSQRAKFAILLMSIFCVINAINIVYEFADYYNFRITNNGMVSLDDQEAYDSNEMIWTYVFVGVGIVAFVYFLMWFRRAYYNLSQIVNTHFDNVWAVIAWFIPILNLFRPYQLMREVWYNTQIYSNNGAHINAGTILNFWWAFWIIGDFPLTIWSFFGSTDELPITFTLYILGGLFKIISSVLMVIIITKISTYERALFENRHERDITDHLITTE